LAKKVLEGKTKGYTQHPQLHRFLQSIDPIELINRYLYAIYIESICRHYHFDKSKIEVSKKWKFQIPVNSKQVSYEFELLKSKLIKRDVSKYLQIKNIVDMELNPVFYRVMGEVENWERIIPGLVLPGRVAQDL